MRVVWAILRWFCYVCLVVSVVGVALPFVLQGTGVCSTAASGWSAQCDNALFESAWMAGAVVVMGSIFMGFPILPALVGAVILALKVVKAVRPQA
ncbi:MAG: hypothetical protein AAGD34_00705 [Pseudomonadota bacterium]